MSCLSNHEFKWVFNFDDGLWHGFGVNAVQKESDDWAILLWPTRAIIDRLGNCRLDLYPILRRSPRNVIPSVLGFRLVPETAAQQVVVTGVLSTLPSYLLINTAAWCGPAPWVHND